MKNNLAIKISNISKKYRIGLEEEKFDSIFNQLISIFKSPLMNYKRLKSLSKFNNDESNIVWALKNISFEVKKGEVVGIIGANGAGKSTLLKVLSQITSPSEGEILINGRIASLLEVGTGFHPDLTGRENVFLNGTILGMSKNEIDKKFNSIVDFSGIKKFIDTPVKRYSSGMRVRLAFAVAAFLDPEILLIDEVLAVGDSEFQKKAIGKMKDISESKGKTVFFVSHNMSAIKSLCTSSVLLEGGKFIIKDSVDKVISQYLKNNKNDSTRYFESDKKIVSIRKVVLKRNGIPSNIFYSGDNLTVEIKLKRTDTSLNSIFVGLYDSQGVKLSHFGSDYARLKLAENTESIKFEIKKLPLAEGNYFLNFSLHLYGKPYHRIENAMQFEVFPGDYYGIDKNVIGKNGVFLIDSNWYQG